MPLCSGHGIGNHIHVFVIYDEYPFDRGEAVEPGGVGEHRVGGGDEGLDLEVGFVVRW